jgi:hypothetical protein
MAVKYTGQRVDHWVRQLRNLLKGVLERHELDKQCWSGSKLAVKAWTAFKETLYEGVTGATEIEFREQIVGRAYECIVCTEVHNFLNTTFETKVGSQVWYALKFLARPIADCRLLRQIASIQPHFQRVRILPVPTRGKTQLSPEYQIGILDTWQRLDVSASTSTTASSMKRLAVHDEQFKRDCAEPYILHAEMQLVMEYEDNARPVPILDYFGCSKKACLLCEGFLQALPRPIATRGRHGICYLAWGVPPSRSAGVAAALKGLETTLVSRIKMHLQHQALSGDTLLPRVKQSTFVSDFSDSIVQDLFQRVERSKAFKETEMVLKQRRRIL